jgi:XTP/dITP diphosphohydrolase
LATRSAGKLRELRPLFDAAGVRGVTLDALGLAETADEETIEAFDTFEANALAKARWFYERGDGRPVIADDSGLEVLALDGAPGVYSKRWSGRHDVDGAMLDAVNNAHLLARLCDAEAIGRTDRSARYVCVAACVWGAGEVSARGTVDGTILREPRGAGGFGYDPYFFSPELGDTFAAVTVDAKTRVSHRGRAVAALLVQLHAHAVL